MHPHPSVRRRHFLPTHSFAHSLLNFPVPCAYLGEQNFYLHVRQALIYADELAPWEDPEDPEQWLLSPCRTVKLDTMVVIVLHHLERDGRRMLTVAPSGQLVEDVTHIPYSAPMNVNVTPDETDASASVTGNASDVNTAVPAPVKTDKIVIFSPFPSTNKYTLSVSSVNLCTCPTIHWFVLGSQMSRREGRRAQRRDDDGCAQESAGDIRKQRRGCSSCSYCLERRQRGAEHPVRQHNYISGTKPSILFN